MSLSGPALGTGVPADDLDAGGGGLLEQRRLLLAVDAGVENAGRLHGDRLLQSRGATGHRALAVELANLPAERLGGFRGAVGGALRAAVAPVGERR